MNDNNIKTNTIFNNRAIQDLKKISMTSEEKKAMLGRIMPSSIRSPWSIYSFSVWISRNRWAYVVVAVVLIISLTGGSVAFAAEGSLPGDILYPVKINVTEPLRVALAPSIEAKASLEASFANERVQEGEALAAQDKLDQPKQAELSRLIAVQTRALNTTLTAIASSEPQVAEKISVDFRERMDEHARHLDTLVATSSVITLASPSASARIEVNNSIAATTSTKHINILNLAASVRESSLAVSSSTDRGHGSNNGHQKINKENNNPKRSSDSDSHRAGQTLHSIPAIIQTISTTTATSTALSTSTSSTTTSSASSSVQIDVHTSSSSVNVNIHEGTPTSAPVNMNVDVHNHSDQINDNHGLIDTIIKAPTKLFP